MTLGMNSTLRSARMTAVLTDLDKNASAGTIEFYSGTRPPLAPGSARPSSSGPARYPSPAGP